MVAPGSSHLRRSSSKLPRMQPMTIGRIAPTINRRGISAMPEAPNATIVKKGPSLIERMETAPTSLESPNSLARAAYRPPLELEIPAIKARGVSPQKPAGPQSLLTKRPIPLREEPPPA